MNYQIRKIRLSDNPFIAKVIRNVFHELDAPKEGTAYADPILDSIFEEYQIPQTVYFVVEVDGEICGGAGIGILDTNDPTICELQKMYFAPKIRGKGIAYELMQQCLRFAKQAGYTYCYIETLPFMKAAQQLYSKSGFDYIDKPLGATGHTSCDVFMLKKL